MGFPHSDTCGSTLICSSPQLFAAYRVLLRLPMPRHSPCALSSLNFMSSANLFRLKCSCDSLVTVLIFRSSTRYVVVVTLCVSTSVILLDLLFLHLCFIQFSRYISFRLSPFMVFGFICRGPRPHCGSWRFDNFASGSLSSGSQRPLVLDFAAVHDRTVVLGASLTSLPAAFLQVPKKLWFSILPRSTTAGGLKWARTTDLALIRRTL